jgi:hypothetical protein
MRWYRRIGQVIVPNWNTQTGVGVIVADAVRVGTGVWVGTKGVDVSEGVVRIAVEVIEGVEEKFFILQPEIIIRNSDMTNDFI